jgi:hypothetical protein
MFGYPGRAAPKSEEEIRDAKETQDAEDKQ